MLPITHFTYQSYFAKNRHKEWKFSFFYDKTYYQGYYHYNGEIEWLETQPIEELREKLQSSVHELMLFHVYD